MRTVWSTIVNLVAGILGLGGSHPVVDANLDGLGRDEDERP